MESDASGFFSLQVMDEIFFFQAEDGIRDGTVTGVQTCALPIYPQQTGMSPWAAGGLGAVGGGLLGYQLGQMAGEHDQQLQEGDAGNPDQMATLDAGGYDPGMADSV